MNARYRLAVCQKVLAYALGWESIAAQRVHRGAASLWVSSFGAYRVKFDLVESRNSYERKTAERKHENGLGGIT